MGKGRVDEDELDVALDEADVDPLDDDADEEELVVSDGKGRPSVGRPVDELVDEAAAAELEDAALVDEPVELVEEPLTAGRDVGRPDVAEEAFATGSPAGKPSSASPST